MREAVPHLFARGKGDGRPGRLRRRGMWGMNRARARRPLVIGQATGAFLGKTADQNQDVRCR